MKLLLHTAILTLALSQLFVACSKTDVLSKESLSTTVVNDASTPDLNKCKIRRIYHAGENPYDYTGLFTYNKAGNPYSIVFSGHLRSHYFFYDTQNRLKEYHEFTFGLTFRHYYRHNAAGQIVIDSAIYPGSDARDTAIYVSHIEYDPKGRVVKETIVNTRNDGFPLAPTRRPTYTYDNRGNLAVKGWKSSSYDYKINPLRQNPIFQFVLRNYSMNNPAPQKRYNSLGLPTSLNPSNDVFFGGDIGATRIIYDGQ